MKAPFAALLLPLLAALAVPAAAAERRYSVTGFDRIVVEGPYEVRLVTGRPPGAHATGSREAIDRVSVDVQGQTLRIRPNRSAWGGYPGDRIGPVRLDVSVHELRAAAVTGSGTLDIDRMKAMRADIGLEGSGRIRVGAIEADQLVVNFSGSGTVALGGRAKELRATLRGSGDLDAEGFTAEGAEIHSESAGRIRLTVAREARIVALGAGDIEIAGNPACTVRTGGAGRVRCGRSDQGELR